MTAPAPPPMLHYAIYMDSARFDVVTSQVIIFDEMLPKWIKIKEYHPNVEKYYWNTQLREVWINTKRIDAVKFIGYVKAPLGEAKQ